MRRNGGWIAVGGGAAIVLGSLMPWATVNIGRISISKNGIDGDGQITATLGAVIVTLALLTALRGREPAIPILGTVASGLAFAVAVYDVVDVANTDALTVGFGLVVCTLGSIVAIAGGLIASVASVRSGESVPI